MPGSDFPTPREGSNLHQEGSVTLRTKGRRGRFGESDRGNGEADSLQLLGWVGKAHSDTESKGAGRSLLNFAQRGPG